jgi:hypothetical protein
MNHVSKLAPITASLAFLCSAVFAMSLSDQTDSLSAEALARVRGTLNSFENAGTWTCEEYQEVPPLWSPNHCPGHGGAACVSCVDATNSATKLGAFTPSSGWHADEPDISCGTQKIGQCSDGLCTNLIETKSECAPLPFTRHQSAF